MEAGSEIKIVVDAMGGDFAPHLPVRGALEASREFKTKVILVGDEREIKAEMSKHDLAGTSIEIVHAEETIRMDEEALQAVRKKKKSSIRVAAEIIKNGKASGMVSAGNTGAIVAIMKVALGTLEGVERPALAILIPHMKGFSIVIDVGANVDCKPVHLKQFAIMGSIYAREILGIQNPKIGLLSIGEEEIKGNELIKEVHKSLKEAGINFIGNMEGKDVYAGVADVIVCDGFVGNIVLKTSESIAEMIENMLREELSRTFWRKVGFFFAKGAFATFKKRLDYSEYGGAPLLGVKGIAIICHGRSPAKAIKNAIKVAINFSQYRLNDRIQENIKKSNEKAVAL
jgi:phosphate acyltransferase